MANRKPSLIVAGAAAFLAALIAAVCPTYASPAPTLTTPPPVYLKQGESQDVTFTGQHLAGVLSVAVPDPRGLDAALVKPDKPQDGAIEVKLSASADAPLGTRELRFVGAAGVTEPVTVTVGQYPLVLEKEPNNTQEQAQPVQLPAIITGKIEPAGDVDQFRFDAEAGQHLIFDVFAARLASPLEPVLAIHDSAGRELPFAIEHHDADPLLVFDAPADGSYVLEVRDLQYRGGGDYAYRIEAGQIPYVESLSPGSGQRGTRVEVTAVGHNLAGGEKMTLDLTDAVPGPMPVRFKTPLGYSNEIAFAVSEMTAAREQEPNDTPETANLVNIPADISGTLDKPGDEDWFKFHVAAKQTVTLEVIARRTGSPVDALLTLKNAKGDVIETSNGPVVGISAVGNVPLPDAPEISTVLASPDAEAKISRELEPGDYFVSIRDLTRAGGPGYAYRLEISPLGGLPADFNVRFLPDAPRLHRGGNVKLWCDVQRTDGYKGDITITLEGLPAGVTAQPVTLGESSSGIFTLAAADDAALGPVPIKLKATGVLGSQQAVRYARPELNGRSLQQAYLTVLDPAPFNVEAIALLKPEQIQQYGSEVAELARKLDTQTPQLDAAEAEWEKHVGAAADAKTALPTGITAILKTPADKRTPDQTGALKAYYRSIAPELAADRAKLAALRNGIGPYAELARMEFILEAGSSEVDADQTRWEQAQTAGAGWTPLTFAEMKSAGGATFTREADGSVFVGGNNPATDVYTLIAATPIRNITAVRLEVLPDQRLAGAGPGRSATGNFILTRLQLLAAPAGAGGPATAPVELHSPRATFEQTGWQAIGALDDRNDTGWGIAPQTGRPNSAVFLTRSPIAGSEGGSALTFTLEQLSANPQNTLGRFRVWVTANPDPGAAVAVPAEIRAILAIPSKSRNEEQKASLAGYHRSIDASLDPVRQRLAELKSKVAPLPLTTARKRTGSIPVPVQRIGDFRGDIQITLEGFTEGRDPKTGMPPALRRDLALSSLTIAADSAFGKLTYKVNAKSETGTRLVVLRAEAQVGDETIVQYSPAFPLTVNEK